MEVVAAPGMAEPGGAGDGKQRPLVPRSRCSPRLAPSVRRLPRLTTH
jgi:hypothetical protein